MFIVFVSTLATIVLAVLFHFEVLLHLKSKHFKPENTSRWLLPIGVLVMMLAHVIEIWMFAFLYYILLSIEGAGTLTGEFNYTLVDCAYFSFINYTTVGYGDIVPTGDIRFAAGAEALLGLVLITWTASFTYIHLQNIFKTDKE